ncbi:MAG: 4Fe-4S dicluster domain-containing protein, partial [Gammaproteobacteria bacterium]
VYIQYRAERCAHTSKGVEGCSLCLEGCPAGALRSENGGIVVQAELCHGCGLCASRCPTGAIRYDYPSLNGVLTACLEALHASSNAPDLTLRIAGEGTEDLTAAEGVRDLVLPSVASFGPELWLSLLAMGWARVVLETGTLPPSTQTLLREQIRHWNSLLDTPRILEARDAGELAGSAPARTLMALPETYRTWPGDKRRLISQSLARLLERGEDFVSRPAGFPLGRVAIHAETCTQCRACAQVCPTDALAETEDPVGLQFTATTCAQCGICEAACPEQAIRLEPGLDMNPDRRDTPQTLFEVNMARCTRCGAPIMAAGVIESLRRKLGDDAAVNLEVLKLCNECRVDEMFGFPAREPDD